MELQGSSCRTTSNFARESLVIRMRTISSSVTALVLLRGFPSVSVLHMVTRNLSKPSIRWLHPHLGTSVSLAPSDQFRTETTSPLTTIIRVDRGLNAILCVFDVTLNSSIMFSSLFAVVQSSEFHCLQCLAWAADDFFFFCITASSSFPVAIVLFTYSCNPPMHPSSVVPCHSAPLRAVHLTRLPLLDMNSRRP